MVPREILNTWRIIRIIPPQNMSSIKRVGIVLKPHQPQALKTLCELTVWLGERGIELVGGPQIEHERIEHETGCTVREVDPDDLAASSDLVLVLGGDGTMIATARLIANEEVPVLGVNYGGLGYLTEFRIEELYEALEMILAGNFRLDKRVMLAVELHRDKEVVTVNRVLNNVVINKSALARIIEIELTSTASTSARFSSITSPIRSSTVPWHTSLWTLPCGAGRAARRGRSPGLRRPGSTSGRSGSPGCGGEVEPGAAGLERHDQQRRRRRLPGIRRPSGRARTDRHAAMQEPGVEREPRRGRGTGAGRPSLGTA